MRKDEGRRTKDKGRKERNRKWSRICALVLFAVILCFLSSGLVFWFRGWNGKEPVNIVIASDSDLRVVAVRPDERTATEVIIPPTMMVTLPDGSRWQTRALWDLSQLQKTPSLIETVGWNLLELPIDFSIHVSTWEGRMTSYRRATAVPFSRIPETMRLIQFFRSLRPDQIKTVSLGELPCVRRVVDPGGTELLEVDQTLLAPLVRDWFEIGLLREQSTDVAVRNSRGIAGYGAKLARQLEHVGVRVISVQSGEGKPALLVKSKDVAKSALAKRLSTWYQLPITVNDFDERADILLVQ